MARSMRTAVVDDDTDKVHELLHEIRAGLTRHIAAEQAEAVPTSQTAALLVSDGQRRLLSLIEEVLGTIDDDLRGCACIVRSVEIEIALKRQAQLEERLRSR